MPDYLASYWNGTTEVEVSEQDPSPRFYTVEPRLQRFCGPATLCSTTTFVSTLAPGPFLAPGSHVAPGGAH